MVSLGSHKQPERCLLSSATPSNIRPTPPPTLFVFSWPLKTRTQPKSFASLSPFPLWSGFRSTAGATVVPLPVSKPEIVAGDLTASLVQVGGKNNVAAECDDAASTKPPPSPPSQVSAFTLERRWERGADETSLVLHFTIRNTASEALEVGVSVDKLGVFQQPQALPLASAPPLSYFST